MNGIEAGKAFVKFLLDDKGLRKGLAQVGAKLQSIGKIGTAATAPLVAGFGAATAAFVAAGDELDKMSQRVGFSVEALSELKYAAGQSGTSIDAIEKAAKRMAVGILDATRGTGELKDSLVDLGVNLDALEQMSPEQQFLTLSRAIANVEDPTRRAALAQKVFGRAGTELLPLLAAGADGLDQLRQRAHELGVTLTEEDATAAAILGDNIDDLKLQVYAMGVQIGAAIAGPLTEFLQTIQPIVATIIDWIKNNPDLVKTIAGVSAALAVLSVISIGVGKAFTFLSLHPFLRTVITLTTAITALNEAMKAITDWQLDTPERRRMEEDLRLAKEALAEADAVLAGKAPTPTAGVGADIAADAAALQASADASMAGFLPTIRSALPSDPLGGIGQEFTAGLGELVELAKETLGIDKQVLAVLRRNSGLTVGGF